MATLRSQSYGIWLGPCTEQPEETAVWDPQFPCVFTPEEPYYTSPNDHSSLGDVDEMVRERWPLEREECGLTAEMLW